MDKRNHSVSRDFQLTTLLPVRTLSAVLIQGPTEGLQSGTPNAEAYLQVRQQREDDNPYKSAHQKRILEEQHQIRTEGSATGQPIFVKLGGPRDKLWHQKVRPSSS